MPPEVIVAVAPEFAPVIEEIVVFETNVPWTLFNLSLLLFRKSMTTPLAVLVDNVSPWKTISSDWNCPATPVIVVFVDLLFLLLFL